MVCCLGVNGLFPNSNSMFIESVLRAIWLISCNGNRDASGCKLVEDFSVSQTAFIASAVSYKMLNFSLFDAKLNRALLGGGAFSAKVYGKEGWPGASVIFLIPFKSHIFSTINSVNLASTIQIIEVYVF